MSRHHLDHLRCLPQSIMGQDWYEHLRLALGEALGGLPVTENDWAVDVIEYVEYLFNSHAGLRRDLERVEELAKHARRQAAEGIERVRGLRQARKSKLREEPASDVELVAADLVQILFSYGGQTNTESLRYCITTALARRLGAEWGSFIEIRVVTAPDTQDTLELEYVFRGESPWQEAIFQQLREAVNRAIGRQAPGFIRVLAAERKVDSPVPPVTQPAPGREMEVLAARLATGLLPWLPQPNTEETREWAQKLLLPLLEQWRQEQLAVCTWCQAYRQSMLDGHLNPEGSEEYRATHGHYPGCPQLPQEIPHGGGSDHAAASGPRNG